MTAPSPFTDPDTWDTLVIGSVRFRGTFEWGGDLIKRRLDRRHAPGRDGARTRGKGYDLAEVDLTLTVTNDDEWADLQALVALVFPRAATPAGRDALPCAHPQLALAGISALYGTTLGPLSQSAPTKWTTTIKFVEYRADSNTSTSRTPRVAAAAPDLGANRTAFDIAAADRPPTPPPTPGPARP